MLGVIEESTLLEQEGYDLLAAILTNTLAIATEMESSHSAYSISKDCADLCGSRICDRDDLDQLCILHIFDTGGFEGSIQIHIPLGGKPCEGLEAKYCASPDKCPFGATNIIVISLFREINGEEHWPYQNKWPDVGTK